MTTENQKALRGSLMLLFIAIIWGAAFVAQRAGMNHIGPFAFNGIRMLLGGLVMIPVVRLLERKKRKRQMVGVQIGIPHPTT